MLLVYYMTQLQKSRDNYNTTIKIYNYFKNIKRYIYYYHHLFNIHYKLGVHINNINSFILNYIPNKQNCQKLDYNLISNNIDKNIVIRELKQMKRDVKQNKRKRTRIRSRTRKNKNTIK